MYWSTEPKTADLIMGHRIRAFVAKAGTLEPVVSGLPHAHFFDLPQGFRMLALTLTFTEALHDQRSAGQHVLVSSMSTLSEEMAALAAEASHSAPVAFIATDFFGGIGDQESMVWESGDVILGPLRTEWRWRPSPHVPAIHRVLIGFLKRLGARGDTLSAGAIVPSPVDEWAVSTALRRIGVDRTGHVDEFDALDLIRHRDFDDLEADDIWPETSDES